MQDLDIHVTTLMMFEIPKFLRHVDARLGTHFLWHPSLIRIVADHKCITCPYYRGHVMFYLPPFYQVYEKPLFANNL